MGKNTRQSLLAILFLQISACVPAAIPMPINATQPLPPTATKEPTFAATATLSPEQLGQQQGINIFDAHTFPEKYFDIANNWLTRTDAEWQDYQRFIEAARGKFFEQEGIADEVAAMTGINENLRSLWGVIYYVQMHREQVRADHLFPAVSPSEFLAFLHEPTFESWSTGVITLDDGRKARARYGLDQLAFYPPYENNSQVLGTILGRSDVVVNRDLAPQVSGNLAALVRPFPDNPSLVVEVLAMRTPEEGIYPHGHTLCRSYFS